MSNYTKSTNFATKDNLTPGDPLKVVRGTEIDTEFNNIATAVATKTDNASAAITGGAIDGATVGATTPATGSFTTLAASGTTTLAGALVGAVTQAAFNTVSTTLNLGGAATAVNIGAATGTATVNNTTLAAKAITASTTLAVTGTSTLTGAVTATAGVSGPITSSSVSITGGSITGITDLAVADGGTGASTAAGALNNLLPSQTSNANKYLQTDGTNASWDAVSLSTADITGTLGVANGGTGVTSSTGTGNVVLSNSPTLVTPALGTPSALVGTNITGTASGLTAGNVTTNANLTGAVTSVGNATSLGSFTSAQLATALTDETGSGANVFATSPTLVTPTLGVATATSLQGIIGNVTPAAGAFTTVDASGAVTLSGGTANGVTYLNGSKVLTSGSALTFDGTNLGIANASPTQKLDVAGQITISSGNGYLWGNGAVQMYSNTSYLRFRTASTDRLEIDSAGNLGLGVTPSAWGSGRVALQIGGATASSYITGGTGVTALSSNLYRATGGDLYVGTGFATTYQQYSGTHNWFTAASGTAGNAITFTQAMTLDASGNLLVGATSAAGKLTVQDSGNSYIVLQSSTGGYANIRCIVTSAAGIIGTEGAFPFVFRTSDAERARIDSSGNLLVGTTTRRNNATLTISYSGTTNNGIAFIDTANSSGTEFLAFQNSSATNIGTVARVGTTNAVVYNTTSDYRLKTVTGAVTGQGSRIDALKPIDYLWTEGGQQARGFLAHEFQTVYPNSVTGDKDALDANGNPKYQSMQAATSEVIADLVAEIQSLRQRLSAANL